MHAPIFASEKEEQVETRYISVKDFQYPYERCASFS